MLKFIISNYLCKISSHCYAFLNVQCSIIADYHIVGIATIDNVAKQLIGSPSRIAIAVQHVCVLAIPNLEPQLS